MRTNLLATNLSPQLEGISKQLEYTIEICDQASYHINTKLIGVES